MPHVRNESEAVDAFSAPRVLLAAARKRAAALRMSKSGFYRYCLAKELGYDQAAALLVAEPRSISKFVEAEIPLSSDAAKTAAYLLNEGALPLAVQQAASAKPVRYGPMPRARKRSKPKSEDAN